jgi:hypothetical protein
MTARWSDPHRLPPAFCDPGYARAVPEPDERGRAPTDKHHLAKARSKVGATTTAQLVWILSARLPEPEGMAQTDD